MVISRANCTRTGLGHHTFLSQYFLLLSVFSLTFFFHGDLGMYTAAQVVRRSPIPVLADPGCLQRIFTMSTFVLEDPKYLQHFVIISIILQIRPGFLQSVIKIPEFRRT